MRCRIDKGTIKSGSIGRRTLGKYIEKLNSEQQKNPAVVELVEAIASNVYYVPVSEIQTRVEMREMFDFSMSDKPEFVISGHIVHNCTLYGDTCGGLAVLSDMLFRSNRT